MSGTGAGMFSRLFDSALSLGNDVARQNLLNQPPGTLAVNGTLYDPAQVAAGQSGVIAGAGLNQQTVLIGLALVVGAVLLAKL